MTDPPTAVLAPRPDPPPPDPGPPAVPGFDVRRLVGRGGSGAVYEAHDRRLGRTVALKVLAAGGLADPAARRRFRGEATALAAVRHPGLVQIHEVGADAPEPYLVLEYVPGDTLAARLRRGPVPPAEAARLVRAVAEAVQAVHAAGLVHRDLKPGNLLLPAAPPDSRAAPVKVVDFGLARAAEAGERLTETGTAVGTPEYMAPEQVRGDRAVGPAADVYALGAVLYECLTGRPPFAGGSVATLFHAVLTRDPARPPGWVPADLATVALKCLEKDPARRYPSSAALADDLGRFLDGRPVAARPVGPAGRAVRWARRNRLAAGLMAGQAVAVLAAGGLAAAARVGLAGERAARAEAVDARAEAEAARAEADRERAAAEASLAAARRAVNRVLGLVAKDDRLLGPEFVDFQKTLLAESRPVYDRFLDQRPADPGTLAELAAAEYALGQLEFAAGRYAAAADRFAAAEQCLRAAMAGGRADPATRSALGFALGRRAAAADRLGRRAEATAGFAAATAELEAAAAAAPDDPQRWLDLATGYLTAVLRRAAHRDPAADRRHARAALAAADRLPDDAAFGRQRAALRGSALLRQAMAADDPGTAEVGRLLGEAVAALGRVHDLAPPGGRRQPAVNLATALSALGSWHQHRRESAAAVPPLARAADLYARLVADSPAAAVAPRVGLIHTLVTRAEAAAAAAGWPPAAARADLRRAAAEAAQLPPAERAMSGEQVAAARRRLLGRD